MSDVTIDFIDRIVRSFPRLAPVLDEHISDNFGEVLSHLFLGDLTRFLVSWFLDIESTSERQPTAELELRALLDDLEVSYRAGDEEVQELISVSFLENLPRPGEEAAELRDWLGPALVEQLRIIG